MNTTNLDPLTSEQAAMPDVVSASMLPNMNVWTIALTLLIILVIAEQARYRRRKQNIAGPKWTIPFMGSFLDSMNPTFAGYLAKWESGALSCVSVFHKFVVIASSMNLSRKILSSPQYVSPCVVDAAKKILMKTNWVFLDGKAHVEYRKGLNTLFTRKSLAMYFPDQLKVYYRYFKEFLSASAEKPIPYMTRFRDLNVATSCRTFFGDYIRENEIAQISEEYWHITAAMELVNFPLALPYTKVWYGIRARKKVMAAFERAAAESRAAMKAGKTPQCMTDQWIKSMLESEEFSKEGGDTSSSGEKMLIREFTNSEIAQTMLSFLFASQDATSSGMSWMFQLLCDHPDVYAKVREEQLAVRNGDPYAEVTLEMTDAMVYTRAMVKETLRFRPPVLMVPYEAKKSFPITPEYTIPKGAMVVPTFWHALHDEKAYPDPSKWDPDRWITGDAEKHPQNYLVFGMGPHMCLGQGYAVLHLMLSAGMACMLYDIEHITTPLSEKIKIFATIFPQDDCILQWKKSKHNRD